MNENPRPITIEEYRERRKPFPFTSSKGITVLLQPLSIYSMISCGALPNALISVAIELSEKRVTRKSIEENSIEYTKLVELLIIKGVAEPKISAEGAEGTLGIGEIDDQLKLELFNAIMRGNPNEKEQEDLRPFPANAGGGADGAGGAVLESEAE